MALAARHGFRLAEPLTEPVVRRDRIQAVAARGDRMNAVTTNGQGHKIPVLNSLRGES